MKPEPGTALYYMAPFQNAPFIAVFGILSYNKVRAVPELQEIAKSIADPFVNSRRERRNVGGRSLHDFVPLYWATHTPMQYVVTIKERRLAQEELVFFLLHARTVLGLPGVWTTDGNAASSDSNVYEGDGAVPHLDWHVISTPNCYSPEYKRKKCAEVLVPDRVPPDLIDRICVRSELAQRRLRKAISTIRRQLANLGTTVSMQRVEVDPELYYEDSVDYQK